MSKPKIDPKPECAFVLCESSVPQQYDLIGMMHFGVEPIIRIKLNKRDRSYQQMRVQVTALKRLDKRGNCWEIRGSADDPFGSELKREFRAQFIISRKFGWFGYLAPDASSANVASTS